ncbi:MAG: hypothetical protein KGQ41_04885 [Alphaproteobacteria bacterium]|nr:hypothetical protein [Alphaproteobacteria bacterium]
MELENSLRRLGAVVAELEKAATAAAAKPATTTNQIDMFAGVSPRKPSVDNTLMAKKLDRTIERIENLLQVGSR